METIEELNKTIQIHRQNNDLTRTELAVLDILAKYSCVDIGISYLRKSKIAEFIGMSRRTVVRACNRLEVLGIIRQFKRMRETGDRRQTSNQIVIQPAKRPNVTPKCHTEEAPIKTLKNKILNKRKGSDNSHTYDHTYVSSNIPQDFIEAVRPFFPTPKEIYKLWSRLTLAASQSRFPGDFEAHIADWVKTFKEAVYREKQGKVRGDFLGYLYGAWRTSMRIVACRLNRDQFGSWLYAD